MKTLTQKLNESFIVEAKNSKRLLSDTDIVMNTCKPILDMIKKDFKSITNAKQDLYEITINTLKRTDLDNYTLHDIIDEWSEYLEDNVGDIAKDLQKSIKSISKKLTINFTYNNFNELKKLKSEGVKSVNLNGFSESIDYVINLKLNDNDLIKIDNLSYETTY